MEDEKKRQGSHVNLPDYMHHPKLEREKAPTLGTLGCLLSAQLGPDTPKNSPTSQAE